jgi:hypothetical protein
MRSRLGIVLRQNCVPEGHKPCVGRCTIVPLFHPHHRINTSRLNPFSQVLPHNIPHEECGSHVLDLERVDQNSSKQGVCGSNRHQGTSFMLPT